MPCSAECREAACSKRTTLLQKSGGRQDAAADSVTAGAYDLAELVQVVRLAAPFIYEVTSLLRDEDASLRRVIYRSDRNVQPVESQESTLTSMTPGRLG